MAVVTTPRKDARATAPWRPATTTRPCRFLAVRPSDEEIDRLATGGETLWLARTSRVFSEGDLVDAVYVIRRGTVALGRTIHGRTVTLVLLREGDIFGDVPTLLRAPASCDATAKTDTEVIRIPAERFLATLHRSPEFAQRWVVWLAGRLSSAHTRLLSVLAGDVRSQVAAVLAHEACRSTTVHLTHVDIAAMVGAQRSSVTRVLDDLAAARIVSTGYGHVTILDRDALARIAMGAPTGGAG